MPKKQSTKRRTRVKDLTKKEKKLSAGEMKEVKGGDGVTITFQVVVDNPFVSPTREPGKTR